VGAMNGRSRSRPAGMTSVPQVEEIAWVVLRAANRKQARGSTARLVIPSVLEVAQEIAAKLGYDRLLAAEDYLLERGYVRVHHHARRAEVAREDAGHTGVS
jgi:hypothetical protein